MSKVTKRSNLIYPARKIRMMDKILKYDYNSMSDEEKWLHDKVIYWQVSPQNMYTLWDLSSKTKDDTRS